MVRSPDIMMMMIIIIVIVFVIIIIVIVIIIIIIVTIRPLLCCFARFRSNLAVVAVCSAASSEDCYHSNSNNAIHLEYQQQIYFKKITIILVLAVMIADNRAVLSGCFPGGAFEV